MGSGGSRNLQIVEPKANVTALPSHPEYPYQEQLSHDREDERNEESSSQEDDEWDGSHTGTLREDKRNEQSSSQEGIDSDVSHTGTLNREDDSSEVLPWDLSSATDTLAGYKRMYPEQAEDFQKVFENMQVLRDTKKNSSTKSDWYSKNVVVALRKLEAIHKDIRSSTGTVNSKIFLDFVVEMEAAELLQWFATKYFEDFHEMSSELDNKNISSQDEMWKTCMVCLRLVLRTMLNFSDLHEGFCWECTQEDVVPMCLENLDRLDSEYDNWQSGDEESEPLRLIKFSIGILHNISRQLRDRDFFPPSSEKTLLYFAKVKNKKIALLALLCLAYLVNEDTNHLISADETLLCFIITMLNKAYQSEDRTCIGFSATELVEGLSHLAINDNNKKILGKNGAIPVLTRILQTPNDDEETESGARALWMLSFDETNKVEMSKQEGTLETLRTLQHSENFEVQRAAAGAVWEIEERMAREMARENADKTEETTGNHVMISYQWDDQAVLREVKNKLKSSGYRVWMDLEQMGGSTLESMAKAVENAAVVLVCVSERYKDSQNCRSEAEYAYQQKKETIPLMMQRNYKPNGWLGMLLGTKLWINFQSKHVIDSGVRRLIKELGGRGKDVDTTDGPGEALIRPSEAGVVAAPPPPSVTNVSSWTNQDVKKWLTEIGLEHVCKEDISEFNGQRLIDLQELRGECPEYFYKCLEHTINLKNMFHLLKFKKELDKLLSH